MNENISHASLRWKTLKIRQQNPKDKPIKERRCGDLQHGLVLPEAWLRLKIGQSPIVRLVKQNAGYSA